MTENVLSTTKDNVVLTVFDVESEAFQAFTELRGAIAGNGYAVAEAALIRNKGGHVEMLDAFTLGSLPGDDTAMGMVIGSLIGVLGGPVGVILGAGMGAWAGSIADVDHSVYGASTVAVMAGKIFEGETAIVALVEEEEPAFDAVFAAYKTTNVRYDAADIAAEAETLLDLQNEVSNQVIEQVRADHKAELAERREERQAAIDAYFEETSDVAYESFKKMDEMKMRPI